MKKQLLFLLIAMSFGFFAKSQITYNLVYTPASCATCCDASVSLDNVLGGCPAYQYTWSNGSIWTHVVQGLCPGDSLTFAIVDACGNSTQGSTARMGVVGLKDNSVLSSVSLFPNPAVNSITITSGARETIDAVRILDITGKTIIEYKDVFTNKFEWKNDLLEKGMYYFEVSADSKKKYFEVVITE